MTERSQFILDYPLKEEAPANIIYKYKKDNTDDDLNDKIVFSKKQFHFEENSEVREDELHLRRFRELAIESDSKFSQLVDIADPKDQDFNYSSVQKLSHEYFYEIIEDQLRKFKKTQQILDVFKKPNSLVNFFLSDFDPPSTHEATTQEKEVHENNDAVIGPPPSRKDSGEANNCGYKAIALRETYSQGKDFFFISTSLSYEVVKEYPDGIYVEVRNRENSDQIGIFKKRDLQRINLNTMPSNDNLMNNSSNNTGQQYPLQETLKYQQQQSLQTSSQQQSIQQSESSIPSSNRQNLDSKFKLESDESSARTQKQFSSISGRNRSASKKILTSLMLLKSPSKQNLTYQKKIK